MKNILLVLCAVWALSIPCYATSYGRVSVHDPSIVRAPDGMYYIIGSHMAGARTMDLMRWTQVGRSASNQPYFDNITTQLSEALTWGETNTFWAADYVQLRNGQWLMYYCVCEGSKPQGATGYAIANSPEGKFHNLGILRYSNGNGGRYNPGDGSSIFFNISNMPNAVDPTVFYDKTGRLWMVYGSYSGGIFILELDPDTGNILPKAQQPIEIQNAWNSSYGKRLMGGGCSMEAPYIMYSPETDYYYMFISMGGLGQLDGYNVRVARCKTPYGTYLDEKGQNMAGANGSDNMMYNYGLKVMGNHRFQPTAGELNRNGIADANYPNYMSPGHNSAYYDSITGRYYLVFHTRFNNTGEGHEVKVHPFEMNSNGWPVIAPLPYSGEVTPIIETEQLAGTYQLVNLGTGVSKTVIQSQTIQLLPNGTITGAMVGIWERHASADNAITMRLAGRIYRGRFFYQFDPRTATYKWTFALSGAQTNATIWGIQVLPAAQPFDAPLEAEADYVLINAKSGHVLSAAEAIDGNATQQLYANRTMSAFRLHYNSRGQAWQLQSKASGYVNAIGFRRNMTTANVPITTSLAADTIVDDRTLFDIVPNANGTYSLLKRGMANRAIRAASDGLSIDNPIQSVVFNASSEDQQWLLIKVAHAPILDAIEDVEADGEAFEYETSGFTIHCRNAMHSVFTLYDMSGREITSAQGTEARLQVATHGVYIVVATTLSGEKVSRRIVL